MTKIGRNDPCHCGSGEKYKKCCLPKHYVEANTDLKIINRIFEEEKEKLNIHLPHILKPFRGGVKLKGSKLLEVEDVFHCKVVDITIELMCEDKKVKNFREEEIRITMRHELCHVLDFLEGKIGYTFQALALEESEDNFPDMILGNSINMEMLRSYQEFMMAKRYIRLYGLEEFKKQNEIGMEEYLASFFKDEVIKTSEKIASFILFVNIYGLFKEAIKVSFYGPQDPRFPVEIWKITKWLCEDFDYIDSLNIEWHDKSSLLAVESLVIFGNIDLSSILKPPLSKVKEDFTLKVDRENSGYTQELVERWLKRFKLLG